ACADAVAALGLRVAVVDRGGIAGGTTSAGEGNILVSDKAPGPELDLALRSAARWRSIADEVGAEALEYEPKGGVVVARRPSTLAALGTLMTAQRAAGVSVEAVDRAGLAGLEPNLTGDVAGGAWYPQDAQVQPMLATAALLRRARAAGATLHLGVSVTAITRDAAGEVTGVRTDAPESPAIAAPWVVNAAGTWAGDVAALAGAPIPILPRRGFILVTEPLPRVVRHKVYTAEYVANVASSGLSLETSVVVEGTRGGTVLIGASRERVGFDATFSLRVVRRLAAQAVELFPFLADVSLLRTYLGFRPYCPDHLPIIGEDARAPGLVHACGHEGAGIGLAAATGELLAQHLAGRQPDLELAAFRPERFAAGLVTGVPA
ncbi:MAG TPA: FAD-dependent oxidoreductase, partial [Candidatus Limnocylindrales bacterium]|nr:FAD-dependent oxidoreductase [Candidatus Limnocylindrales bacterium]